MGMRASIAYVSKDKTVRMTTVQWSTMIDQTLGYFIAECQRDGLDYEMEVMNLLRTITRDYEHISALNFNDAPSSYGTNKRYLHNIVAESVCNVDSDYDNLYASAKNIPGGIYDYHLDSGSIGVVYRENAPDKLEFFWDDDNKIATRKCSMKSLGHFYKDYLTKPNKRKKFSFRNVA